MNRTCCVLIFLLTTLAVAGPSEAGARDSSVAEEARTLINSVESRCMEASDPGELSGLWVELDATKTRLESGDQGYAELIDQLRTAGAFVGHWKRYLTAHGAGNRRAAFDVLEQLLADPGWVSVVGRSNVLARYEEKLEFHRVEYPTATVQDLHKVIEALQKATVYADVPGRLVINDNVYDLDPSRVLHIIGGYADLLKVWESRTERNWEKMVRSTRISSNDYRDIVRFKRLVMAWALAGYLDLPEVYHFDPSPDATALQHLDAIIDLATSRKDFVTLWRAMSFRSELSKESDVFAERLDAIDFCLTGRELESIGAMERAVAAYVSALSCSAEGVAIEFATERLAEFRKSLPEAYRIGTRRNLLSSVRKPPPKTWNRHKPWTKY